VSYRIPPIFIADFLSNPVSEVTMSDVERTITALAAQAASGRPPGLVQRLKRAPNSLRWRLIFVAWSLKREWLGIVHRLQRRRIVHFLHIGKTGGTAVRSTIRGRENSSPDAEIALRDHTIDLDHVPRGEKVVFFVRDPVSRFVSGFYGRWRKDQPRHNIPWSPSEEVAFSQFGTPNELALALSSDDEKLQKAAANAIQGIQHINRPQWRWFKNENYFLSRQSDILFIGFQETLNEDFALLKRILNLPDDITLPDDEVVAHRNPASVDKRLDDQATRNLKAWYRRDYQFLEHCQKIAAQIRSDLEGRSRQTILSEVADTAAMVRRSQSPQAHSAD
jgi:hypothetical protein